MAKAASDNKKAKESFSFTLDSKGMEATIKLAQSIVSSSGASSFVVESDGVNVWLVGFSDSIMVKLFCSCVSEVSGSGKFGCEPTMLLNAVKNRSEMKVTHKDTAILFKAKKGPYTGDLVTLPISEDSYEAAVAALSLDKNSKKSATKLSEELLDVIQVGLSCTNISAVHSQDPLETFIRLSKGKLEITSSDSFHLAFYSAKVDEKDIDLKLSIPKSHFDTLSKLASAYTGMKKATRIFMGSDRIVAVHDAYSIVLPATQSNDSNYLRAKEFLSNLPKANCKFRLNKKNLIGVLENVTSVYEEGAYVVAELISKKDNPSFQISIKTLYGSASDSIALDNLEGKAFTDKLDPRMLLDILSVMHEDDLEVQMVAGKHYTISYKSKKGYTATYMGCSVE